MRAFILLAGLLVSFISSAQITKDYMSKYEMTQLHGDTMQGNFVKRLIVVIRYNEKADISENYILVQEVDKITNSEPSVVVDESQYFIKSIQLEDMGCILYAYMADYPSEEVKIYISNTSCYFNIMRDGYEYRYYPR